jgi:hypothetical protein
MMPALLVRLALVVPGKAWRDDEPLLAADGKFQLPLHCGLSINIFASYATKL